MHIGHNPLVGHASSTLVLVLVVDIEFRYEEFLLIGFGMFYLSNHKWLWVTGYLLPIFFDISVSLNGHI
jgi:hypothetical protein